VQERRNEVNKRKTKTIKGKERTERKVKVVVIANKGMK
jgi:hypothetical protein